MPLQLELEQIKAWCDAQGLTCLVGPGQLAIPHRDHPEWKVVVIPRPEARIVRFALVAPWTVPSERLIPFVLAVSLANSSMYMGAWVFTHKRMSCHMRIALPAHGQIYADRSFGWVLKLLFEGVDTKGALLQKVALEGAPPETVLQR